MPWMMAGWLVAYSAFVARWRFGWMAVPAGLAILLVKRVDWPPGLWVLALIMALVAAIHLFRGWAPRKTPMPRRWLVASSLCLGLAWLTMAWNWHDAYHGPQVNLSGQRPVVCIGDSLTSGIAPQGGYVPLLRKRLSVPVIDVSHEGITTAEALQRLPELIAAHPQAVVIELGGHDFLKGYDRAHAKSQLKKLIDVTRQLGAQPILWEVPRGFITDPFAGLERELAREEDLELIPDTAIRQLVAWSPFAPPGIWMGGPYLSDDGLHPNDLGNEKLARDVAAALVRVFGEEILSRP
jgi:lysophospholipase L1-like esterase